MKILSYRHQIILFLPKKKKMQTRYIFLLHIFIHQPHCFLQQIRFRNIYKTLHNHFHLSWTDALGILVTLNTSASYRSRETLLQTPSLLCVLFYIKYFRFIDISLVTRFVIPRPSDKTCRAPFSIPLQSKFNEKINKHILPRKCHRTF